MEQITICVRLNNVLVKVTSRVALSDFECSLLNCFVSLANFMLSALNQSVDPCEDFFQFTCGSFLNNARIGDDESLARVTWQMDKVYYDTLIGELEQPIDDDDIESIANTKRL